MGERKLRSTAWFGENEFVIVAYADENLFSPSRRSLTERTAGKRIARYRI